MGILPSFVVALGLVHLVIVVSTETSCARLSTNFYAHSCPHLLPTVRSVVQSAIEKEARMGASLLRLHFHDCFVNVSMPSLFLYYCWTCMVEFAHFIMQYWNLPMIMLTFIRVVMHQIY